MRTVIWILVILTFAAIVIGGYYSTRIGLLGGSYWYYQCERGYATYPYGVTDSDGTYYDSTGKQVGVCNSWIAGPSCEPAKKIVGECDGNGIVRWSLFYKPSSTENFENIQTITSNTQTTQGQKAQTNTGAQVQNPSSIPSASTQSVSIAASGKYSLSIPANWHTEEIRYMGGSISEKDILIYDETNKLAMKITQPLREIGYESSVSSVQPKLGSGIGALNAVLRGDSATPSQGMMHYTWEGEGDFWNNSFEIFVYFGSQQYFKTAADQQSNGGVPLKYTSLSEIKSTGAFRSQIEDIIGGIRDASKETNAGF